MWRPNLLPRTKEQNNRYKNPDNDLRGNWKTSDLSVKRITEKDIYEICTPSGTIVLPPKGRSWSVSKEKFENLKEDNRIWFGIDGNAVPQLKKFITDVKDGIVPLTIYKYTEVGHNQEAQKELKVLFDNEQYFNTPKPIRLLNRISHIGSSNNDIVLDFFSGSATTAHSVMQLNSEDNGNRKYICIQIPEETDEKSEAYKARYKNICEIGKERIRRAGKKILEDNKDKENIKDLDIGFRVLKIDSSNMKDIYYTAEETTQNLFSEDNPISTIENIKEDRKPLDLVFQVMIDWGLNLSDTIIKRVIQNKDVYFVDDNELVACFDGGINEDFINELAKISIDEDILKVVFRDNGFDSDDLKDNVEQIFKQISPNTQIRSI